MPSFFKNIPFPFPQTASSIISPSVSNVKCPATVSASTVDNVVAPSSPTLILK